MSRIEVEKLDTYQGHNDSVYTLHRATDSNRFYSGAGDGLVVQWDLSDPDNGKLIAKLDNSVYAIHLLEEADILAIGHNYDGVHFIDLTEKKEKASLNFTKAAIFDIASYQNQLYVGDGEGFLHIICLNPLKVVDKIRLAEQSIRTLAVNSDKKEISVGTSDNTIKILSLIDFRIKQTLQAHENSVFTLCYSPDYKLLLSAGRDAHLKFWDVEAGYLLIEDIVAHMFAINNIAFSPDGKHFVTCSMDKSIKVWDADRLKLLKVIDKARHAGHGTSVNKLLWTGYKNQLISASDDRTISTWDLKF